LTRPSTSSTAFGVACLYCAGGVSMRIGEDREGGLGERPQLTQARVECLFFFFDVRDRRNGDICVGRGEEDVCGSKSARGAGSLESRAWRAARQRAGFLGGLIFGSRSATFGTWRLLLFVQPGWCSRCRFRRGQGRGGSREPARVERRSSSFRASRTHGDMGRRSSINPEFIPWPGPLSGGGLCFCTDAQASLRLRDRLSGHSIVPPPPP